MKPCMLCGKEILSKTPSECEKCPTEKCCEREVRRKNNLCEACKVMNKNYLAMKCQNCGSLTYIQDHQFEVIKDAYRAGIATYIGWTGIGLAVITILCLNCPKEDRKALNWQ